jgi:ATP/maltotriose-dependent transcriptional regulator MalT
MKLHLKPQSVDDLEECAEGWAAGLQMEALALQTLPYPQKFIKTFRGIHCYLL